MCEWGNTVPLSVPIPAGLSHTGEARWAVKPIDSCIAPIVRALNDAGIYTAACCCGHGERDGEIVLQDGRTLVVRSPETTGDGCPARRPARSGRRARYDVERILPGAGG